MDKFAAKLPPGLVKYEGEDLVLQPPLRLVFGDMTRKVMLEIQATDPKRDTDYISFLSNLVTNIDEDILSTKPMRVPAWQVHTVMEVADFAWDKSTMKINEAKQPFSRKALALMDGTSKINFDNVYDVFTSFRPKRRDEPSKEEIEAENGRIKILAKLILDAKK